MRGMKWVRAYAAGFLIAVGFGSVALDAQAVRYDNIDVQVTPSTDSISPGKGGSYTFYLANSTNGTINSIRFRAYLDAGEFATTNPINAGAQAACTRVTPQSIDCTITGGVESFGYSTFDFAFTAPAVGTAVVLNWDVRFGQGAATNFIATGSTPGANPTVVSLISNSSTEAKAYIPPAGDNLYTGNAIPSGADPFTVGVVVDPAANKVVTAAITEGGDNTVLVPVTCLQPTFKCAKLDVFKKETLPNGDLDFIRAQYTANANTTDLDQRLVIVLRLAASEVAGKNIKQAVLFYKSDDAGAFAQQVADCPRRDPNYVPPVGEPPCIASRIEYTKRTAPDASLIGVWEFTLYASKNGFIDVAF